MHRINIPPPDLQVAFSFALGQFQTLYLRNALSRTVEGLDITRLDRELAEHVPSESLQTLARHGLRGELAFPVPYLLESNPYLLGYYRLLLGFSQKAFYTTEFGVSTFRTMETSGTLSEANRAVLPDLCRGLIESARHLIDGIGPDRVSAAHLYELTLLTVGPQLRGGANVRRGQAGIVEVFGLIHEIVQHTALNSAPNRIEIENAAGRKVLIEFSPDPDLIIREEMAPGSYRNVVAVEVKGGTDYSNVHNRIGEAEKSHQKARQDGYTECWTVVNVDRLDMVMARGESPSTDRFYLLSQLQARAGEAYTDFRYRVLALTGIRENG